MRIKPRVFCLLFLLIMAGLFVLGASAASHEGDLSETQISTPDNMLISEYLPLKRPSNLQKPAKSHISSWQSVALVAGSAIGGALLMFWWHQRQSKLNTKTTKQTLCHVLDTLKIDAYNQLHLVQVENKQLLLASTSQQPLQLISDLSAELGKSLAQLSNNKNLSGVQTVQLPVPSNHNHNVSSNLHIKGIEHPLPQKPNSAPVLPETPLTSDHKSKPDHLSFMWGKDEEEEQQPQTPQAIFSKEVKETKPLANATDIDAISGVKRIPATREAFYGDSPSIQASNSAMQNKSTFVKPASLKEGLRKHNEQNHVSENPKALLGNNLAESESNNSFSFEHGYLQPSPHRVNRNSPIPPQQHLLSHQQQYRNDFSQEATAADISTASPSQEKPSHNQTEAYPHNENKVRKVSLLDDTL